MELNKVYSGMELNDLIEWVDEHAEEYWRVLNGRNEKIALVTLKPDVRVNAKKLQQVLKKLRQHKAVSVTVDIKKTKAVEQRKFGDNVPFTFIGAAIFYELPGGAKGTITIA